MSARSTVLLLACVTTTAAILACGDGETCLGVGAATYITPLDTTLSVGGTVTVRSVSRQGYCSGDSPLPPETVRSTRWHLTDTTVVRLDTLTGLVTGRAVGIANVTDDFQHVAIVRVR